MLNLMFWILLSAISFISLVTIWQREDFNFEEMKESYVVDYFNNGIRENMNTSVMKRSEVNRNAVKRKNKERLMRFYDLEQRTHTNIIKYTDIKDNKRKSINIYPVSDNKEQKSDQGVA